MTRDAKITAAGIKQEIKAAAVVTNLREASVI